MRFSCVSRRRECFANPQSSRSSANPRIIHFGAGYVIIYDMSHGTWHGKLASCVELEAISHWDLHLGLIWALSAAVYEGAVQCCLHISYSV